MENGPLSEDDLEWLDDILLKYGNDASVLDVSELDGMTTALLSGPDVIMPSQWMPMIWGGKEHLPEWASEQEFTRFTELTFQHMNDIGERLRHAPEQFDPLFGFNEIEGKEYLVVEEWCVGYLRGVALGDWSALPESLQPALDAIALHGEDDNLSVLEQMTQEAYDHSQAAIGPAALRLFQYWFAQRTDTLH